MRQKIVSDCRWKFNYYRLSYNIAGQAKGGIQMKILITGFEPFGGETINPSWEAVLKLPDSFQTLKGEEAVLIKKKLPVSFDCCRQIIQGYIKQEKPDCVVCVGQAGGRMAIEPELIAINTKDAQLADNDGMEYHGEPVIKDGPDGRFTKLPVREMVVACKTAGIPANLSLSAGAYVCNCLMYHVLDLIEKEYLCMRGGFIHVPYECRQAAAQPKANKPSLPLATITEGLLECLKVL